MEVQRGNKIQTFNIQKVLTTNVNKTMTDPAWFVIKAFKAETRGGW